MCMFSDSSGRPCDKPATTHQQVEGQILPGMVTRMVAHLCKKHLKLLTGQRSVSVGYDRRGR